MKLVDALEIVRRSGESDAPHFRTCLACGFTPLHLETFLLAHLKEALPSHRVEIETGLYGDLAGTLERGASASFEAVVAVIEWADIDPRLGIRRLGGWRPADVDDILDSAARSLSGLRRLLQRLSQAVPVVCSGPTLPLPPLFPTGPDAAGADEIRLRQLLVSFEAEILSAPGVRLVSAQALAEASPPGARMDVRAELDAGFPYTLRHASALAESLAGLVCERPPKKGLITDLDDTVWAGLLGEVGVDGVSWSLDTRAQQHGLYQQLLASLAAAGVLIGVASKNDHALVVEALRRPDLLLREEDVYPLEVNWGPKSASIGRILQIWNISPDSVVFVDDSPIELAEVQAAFPDLECIAFPSAGDGSLWGFLEQVRRLFSKRAVSAEDSLRLRSIRNAPAALSGGETTAVDQDLFLESLAGSVAFARDEEGDHRSLELINKTNQFNLNGRRLTESSWRRFLADPTTFSLVVSYEDRFGPLGKIATILGRRDGNGATVDWWVMSCRALSRRIEYHCLSYLFEAFGVSELVLDFEPTPRNGVVQDFLTDIVDVSAHPAPLRLRRDDFLRRAPTLVHRTVEAARA